jgi:tetratricopeptide (TPR) repeat protein
MKLFKKIFGGSDPLGQARRAVQQQRWADALALEEFLEKGSLNLEEAAELENLLVVAGNKLAELNLLEGEACLRGGEKAKAVEHFSLAADQARSEEFARRAAEALQAIEHTLAPSPFSGSQGPVCEPSGCSSCGTPETGREEPVPPSSELDPQTRFELILSSYPSDWTDRYRAKGENFIEAFLLAHEGREREALVLFEREPAEERDELYWFERGALLGRLGEFERARADLEEAVAREPGNLLALDTLVGMEMENDRSEEAEKRLRELLGQGLHSAFCHGRLAVVLARREDAQGALEEGLQAMEKGSDDPETLLLTATLLERKDRLDEAEVLLSRLSAGGCGGGANVLLAEFWLRRRKNLDQALESFKGALRQEGDNPRWRLRIAQAYMARGWIKEGTPMLENVLSDPRLDPVLREEGLAQLRGEFETKSPK